MIYLLVAIVSLGGILFGYETGVAAGALNLASKAWTVDTHYIVFLSSGTLIGALAGALSSGKLADMIGRRDVIMATAALFTLGAFVSAISPSIFVLFIGRVIVGVAVGAISVAAPLYIAEIAPAAKRGVLVCAFQLAITAGILLAYLGNEAFAAWPNGWRYMLAMGAIPGIALSGLALLLLESPLWLALHGDQDGARASLAKLKKIPAAELEGLPMQGETTKRDNLQDVFALAGRKALFLCIAIFFFQQFVGINTILYYAPSSLTDLDLSFGIDFAKGTAIPFVLVNFLMTIVAMALIDRIGRRPLLLASFLGMALGLLLVAGGLGTGAEGSPVGRLAATIGLFVFIAFFAVGIGPIAWVTVAEVCPIHVRGLAMSLAVASHWLFDGLASPTSVILTNEFGRVLIFALYGTIALVGFFVFRRIFPENKGATLVDIHRRFTEWAARVQASRFVHYAVTTLVATGGMLTGFNLAITAGTLVLITAEWHLGSLEQGILVSSILFGLVIGAFLAGPMSDRFGRRYVLMSTTSLFVVGAFGCALAPSFGLLIAARVAVGIAIGITAPITGVYVAEIAPTAIRGRLLSFDAVTFSIGVLLAYGVGLIFESQPDGWRYMFAVIAVPSTIYGLALLPLPESPRWLAATGHRSAARRVFHRLNESDAEQLIEDMRVESAKPAVKTWSKLKDPAYRPVLTLGMILMFLLVFSGWEMVLFYAPTVLKEVGFEDTTVSFVATLGFGAVFLVMTLISTWIIDKVGRKPMAVSGLAVMAACLVAMTGLTMAPESMIAVRWGFVACLTVFVGTFALTLDKVGEIIVSEIYPQAIRGSATSLSHATRSFLAMVFSFSFPFVLTFFGLTVTFLFFAVVASAGACYLWRQLPETKGLSLEQISDYWRARSN